MLKNNKGNYAVFFSGGKGICLTCFKALEKGFNVRYLFNLISKTDASVSFHKFSKDLVKLQSDAIRIPVIQNQIYSQKEEPELFERELNKAIIKLKKKMSMV